MSQPNPGRGGLDARDETLGQESAQGQSVRAAVMQSFAVDRLNWRTAFLIPGLAIFSALVIGALIIMATGSSFSDVLTAYRALFMGAFGSPRALSETLVAATPLIMAGLAVALAFRAGLFNIGGEGQILIGGLFAVIIGFSISGIPAPIHVTLAILGGVLGGALWGAIPGYLKAKTGAHEVITTIMLNFIALRFIDYLLVRSFIQREGRNDPVSKNILESAQLPRFMAPVDPSLRVHLGIFIAIAMAALIQWLLFRTKLGFEMRTVGANPVAAKYAGINVGRSYVITMAIAGAMAGIAGALQILGVLGRATPGFSARLGFDGIAVALLGRSNPYGVVLAALLFGALRAGGQEMQATANVGIDIIAVIQALIIIFVAAPALIKAIYRVKTPAAAAPTSKGWSG